LQFWKEVSTPGNKFFSASAPKQELQKKFCEVERRLFLSRPKRELCQARVLCAIFPRDGDLAGRLQCLHGIAVAVTSLLADPCSELQPGDLHVHFLRLNLKTPPAATHANQTEAKRIMIRFFTLHHSRLNNTPKRIAASLFFVRAEKIPRRQSADFTKLD
jgi:hypothetical protein